jgi:hypothetical protein
MQARDLFWSIRYRQVRPLGKMNEKQLSGCSISSLNGRKIAKWIALIIALCFGLKADGSPR